jgi:biopolymer transport protein ExbD
VIIGLFILAAATNPLIIGVSGPPCAFTVAGLPVEPDEMQATLKQVRQKQRTAIIRAAAPDAPWRCLGSAMAALSRAGFKDLSIDPPLPQEP